MPKELMWKIVEGKGNPRWEAYQSTYRIEYTDTNTYNAYYLSQELYPRGYLLGVATNHDLAQEICQNHRNAQTNTQEKPMPFNTQKEIYEALIAGKKLKRRGWSDLLGYVHMVNGMIVDEKGNTDNEIFASPEEWRFFKPLPQTILKNATFLECFQAAFKHPGEWYDFRIDVKGDPTSVGYGFARDGTVGTTRPPDGILKDPNILGEWMVDRAIYTLTYTPRD